MTNLPENTTASKKILIAEDDQFLSKIYQTKLSKEGYGLYIASNGEEALEKAKTNIPDLILLDMIMPKKNGFEVLKELKETENLKTIPVIVLSNLGQNSDMEKAIGLGAKDYIIKTDIAFSSLLTKIQKYLSS